MIGHCEDGPADGLLHPGQELPRSKQLVGKLFPSNNPRMASLFLLAPCLLFVGFHTIQRTGGDTLAMTA
eukprot:CAMPEP_0119092014 /NCGR_PEP_ID=MMETSP1178-20130426/158433_1 /TAXON_ID=33656 /ORGANISM="unid sp, Strain CCMP2000" /LENGTH=68 /DNA_ID=CAMNT_0007075563 /DNA_START=26 /DNA_END=229 /DNA_ORIENTATION=-